MDPERIKKVLPPLAGGLILLGLILYMGGFFRTGLVGPDTQRQVPKEEGEPERVAEAIVEKIPVWYEAVGTVRSRTETQVAAQISARIVSIAVRPGNKVSPGDLLITLDDRELQARAEQARQARQAAEARLGQAEQALVAAGAAYTEAEANYRRVKGFFEQQAATQRNLEQAEAAFKQAQAGVEQAKEGKTAAEAGVRQARKVVEEAQVALGYARITATEAGEVARRLAEPGDLAQPGKPLLVLQAPSALRLEAHVREGLIGQVLPGRNLKVSINALETTLEGTVDEVVPSADPQSRTFLVKVRIAAVAGLYPGMFGRLLVPLGERDAVMAPRESVLRVGQMEMVRVRQDGRWVRNLVKTGSALNGKVEILSGLAGGEEIALPSAAK